MSKPITWIGLPSSRAMPRCSLPMITAGQSPVIAFDAPSGSR